MRKNKLMRMTILMLSIASCLALQGCTPNESVKTMIKTEERKFEDLPEREKEELTKERAELEAQRKAQLGEFYVPLPPLGQEREVKTVKAKALYLTSNVAGFGFDEGNIDYYANYIKAISGESGQPADASRLGEINKLEKALAICKSTEVNALVIDIKNDHGTVTWNSDIELVNQIGSTQGAALKDYGKLMDYLEKNDIYSIARVVAFKDPYFAQAKSEHAIQLKSGGVYKDRAGNVWVNPFDEYVWKYVVAVSQEAALRGFDEIQFDYVRFPDGASYYNPITEFPGRNDRDKDEGIEQFLKYASKELKPYNVHLAADVFGFITHSWDDKPEDIGQTWRKIANQVEYICPMIYPSHYGPGVYGFAVPDQHPYEILQLSLLEAIERNAAQKDPGKIRSWIQGFTASWVKGYISYTPKAISDQIVAGMELGIDEYIIWNAASNYDPMTFFYHDRINKALRKPGEDSLLRTPEAAVREYLEAEKKKNYSRLYLMTPLGQRPADYDEFVLETEKSPISLKAYELLGITEKGEGQYTAKVKADFATAEGVQETKEVEYKIILEKDMYKLVKPESNQ